MKIHVRPSGWIWLAALLAVAAPAHAQAERYALRFRLQSGETLQYRHTATGVQTVERGQQRQEIRSETEGVQVIQVVDTTEQWADIDLRMVVRRILVNGETRTPPQDPAQRLRIDFEGFLIDPRSGAATERDLFLLLPKRPVAVGEAWGRTDRNGGAGPTAELRETYQIVGVESGPLGRVARIRGSLTFTGSGFAVDGVAGARANVREVIEVETEWLIDRGRVLRSRAEGRSELEASAEGKTTMPIVREITTFTRIVEAVDG
ncbi:MAG: hypothetical protein FJX78_03125 [Armatimonadetes bacterium]|nr:hypothetical protein [Armatimonadota bacterium]